MGLGDEIMVTALVKKNIRKNHIPSVIVNSKGLMRWSVAWENNPYILNKKELLGQKPNFDKNYCIIPSGNGGGRPYIDYEKSKHHQFYVWKEWNIEPGEIFLSEKEHELARSFRNHFSIYGEKPAIIIEPTIKGRLQANKDWGRHNWLKLLELLDKNGIAPIQLIHFYVNNTNKITLKTMPIHSIREMFAYLSVVDMIISHEGGFHHAAAALDIPGIVIFGGYISPKITGYSTHINLVGHDIEPQILDFFCGNLVPCPHCRRAMDSILPEKVVYETLKILEKKYG